jgi:RNA polymerase sigma-32 factor
MNTSLAAAKFNLPASIGSLDSYIQFVQSIPILTAEEERTLTDRLRRWNDLEAARQLIVSHLRFVVHIARGYSGYGLPLNDLVQEGNVGLMKAVKRFDPDHEVRLVSFAVHWIRAEIHEFILRNWRVVKIATTKAQRKLFFNLRSSKKRLSWLNSQEVATVAAELGVSPKEVLEMEMRLSGSDIAFDPEPDYDDHEDRESMAPSNYIQDPQKDPATLLESEDWTRQSNQRLLKAMENLDSRSRDILERRWLLEKKSTLHELADEYKVSAERIRQLENNPLKKLKLLVKSD